jgi:hypothetical protein
MAQIDYLGQIGFIDGSEIGNIHAGFRPAQSRDENGAHDPRWAGRY